MGWGKVEKYFLSLFGGSHCVVVPAAVAFVAHASREVELIGVDAHGSLLRSAPQRVARLTHASGMVSSIGVRTLIIESLRSLIRMLIYHVWSILISLLGSGDLDLIFLKFLLIHSFLVSPYNHGAVYFKIELRQLVIHIGCLYSLVQEVLLRGNIVQTFFNNLRRISNHLFII